MASVEWGEYKIGELFNKKTIKGIPKSEENLEENNNGYHVYGQNISYQYPQKVINDSKYLTVLEKDKPIIAYTSSTAQIGIINESFYRTGNNGAFQGLFPKFSENNFKVVIFILECIKRTFIGFGYNTSMANILDIVIQVPTKNNKLDFDFMEAFIAELEAERIAELSAYLTVSGLDNYGLSIEERNALRVYNSMEWREYKLGELFEVKTYKKRFDANKVTLVSKGGNPYVVRKSTENGIKGFISEDDGYLNEGNTISFGQDTATSFYQEQPYFTGDKIKILKAKFNGFNKENAQFFVSAITRSFSKFSWGSSSYSVDIISNQKLALPVLNNEIDIKYIEIISKAISKLAIKDVVQYTDKRIEATKTVVSGHNKQNK